MRRNIYTASRALNTLLVCRDFLKCVMIILCAKKKLLAKIQAHENFCFLVYSHYKSCVECELYDGTRRLIAVD